MRNHIIDPTYFFDAIEEFSFNYEWFPIIKKELNDYGRYVDKFDKKIIRGSLQSKGEKIIRSKTGNIREHIYEFYCKSLYRINIGDFILYNNKWLIVTDVQGYDEYGVREATLKMVELTSSKDLYEYIRFLNGDKII